MINVCKGSLEWCLTGRAAPGKSLCFHGPAERQRARYGRAKVKGVSHYDVFYPFYGKIEFEENETGRNLLLIGDSFSKAVAEPLASHFDKTVLRSAVDGSDFQIGITLKRNKITDVVILLYTDRMMYDLYGDLRLDRILP